MVLQTLAPKRYKPCHVEEFHGTVQQFCVKSETRDTLKFWRHETSLLLVNNRLEPKAAENVKTRNSCCEKNSKLEAFWKFQLWHSNYDGGDDLSLTWSQPHICCLFCTDRIHDKTVFIWSIMHSVKFYTWKNKFTWMPSFDKYEVWTLT